MLLIHSASQISVVFNSFIVQLSVSEKQKQQHLEIIFEKLRVWPKQQVWQLSARCVKTKAERQKERHFDE